MLLLQANLELKLYTIRPIYGTHISHTLLQGYLDEYCKALWKWRDSPRRYIFEASCSQVFPCRLPKSSPGYHLLSFFFFWFLAVFHVISWKNLLENFLVVWTALFPLQTHCYYICVIFLLLISVFSLVKRNWGLQETNREHGKQYWHVKKILVPNYIVL